jgi:murein DD-endopeptidase MepM/ murein hydrolase activator NlpD
MGRSSGRGARDVQAPTRVERLFRVAAAAFVVAVLAASGILPAAPAHALRAADFPSWEEVAAAKRDEASAKALRDRLQGQLQGLRDQAAATQAEADAKGQLYADAQQAYDEQYLVTQGLLTQTATAQAEADEAFGVAAQVISEMSKGGGADVTPRLFTTPGSPDALLDRLEMNRVVGDRYAGLYTKAIELRNTADALADQAEVAQALLEQLRAAAEAAFQVAQEAAIAAAAQLAQTESEIAEVQGRLDYLENRSQEMVAAYNEGIRQQWGDGAAGQISASGYTHPVPGSYVTSHFGMRVNPVSGVYQLHTGTDLAGVGCGATMRAIHAGTVTYAGWNGSWGYYVQIDHGDGTNSGYAHIQAGGIGVSIGQPVAPGQPIAKMGTTGQSTGCHLHLIVRSGGNLVDPVPFLRNQGAPLT